MKPTLLMYATNLSWKPMIVRLETLEKKGLIQFIKNESNQGKRRVDLRTPRFVEITVLGKEELARLRGCLLLRSEELGAS